MLFSPLLLRELSGFCAFDESLKMETIERIKIERKGDREERPLLAGWYITDTLFHVKHMDVK